MCVVYETQKKGPFLGAVIYRGEYEITKDSSLLYGCKLNTKSVFLTCGIACGKGTLQPNPLFFFLFFFLFFILIYNDCF